jgi:glycosyltransferase involved in cell wall biosynthesis
MTGSIRVAMLIQDYLPIMGGAQRQLALVAPLLIQSGVDVQILTRHYPDLLTYERMNGVPVHRLPSAGPKPVASLVYTLAALKKLHQLKPDLIHAYNLFSPLTTALLSKRLTGTPVVVKVLRGGVLGDVDRLRKRAAGRWRLELARRNVDAFITISREIDSELAALGIEAHRRPFIPNGVDTVRFKPLDGQRKMELRHELALPQGPLAIFIGRLVPEKRIRELVADIWPAVRKDLPQANLIILGSGPERQAILQAQTPGVHVVGEVDDVVPYLQTADLFILPSATEGLSNAMLEAMSVGLPVLATRVGGAGDAISHLQNGWLVTPDQPEQILGALLELLTQPEKMVRLGRAARQTIEDQYALNEVGQMMRSLYEDVLSRPQSGRFSATAMGKSVQDS